MENKNKFDSFYIDSFDLMVLKGIETYNDCIANEDIFNPLPVSIQQNYIEMIFEILNRITIALINKIE